MLIYVKKKKCFSSDGQTDVQLKTIVRNLTKYIILVKNSTKFNFKIKVNVIITNKISLCTNNFNLFILLIFSIVKPTGTHNQLTFIRRVCAWIHSYGHHLNPSATLARKSTRISISRLTQRWVLTRTKSLTPMPSISWPIN